MTMNHREPARLGIGSKELRIAFFFPRSPFESARSCKRETHPGQDRPCPLSAIWRSLKSLGLIVFCLNVIVSPFSPSLHVPWMACASPKPVREKPANGATKADLWSIRHRLAPLSAVDLRPTLGSRSGQTLPEDRRIS